MEFIPECTGMCYHAVSENLLHYPHKYDMEAHDVDSDRHEDKDAGEANLQ